MNLREKAIRGIKWTTLSTVISAGVQLLQISILARYLEKSDFGIMAIIMVVIGFSRMLSDLGVSSAIIHKQKVTQNQLSTLYWLNIIIACLIFIIIVLLSPMIAKFYNQKLLSTLIPLVSIVIIIQAFGKQFLVLFEKELKFNIVAKIDIFAVFSGFILAIILAINGFRIYALIYPTILVISLKSLGYVFFGLKYHKPKIYFNLKEVKEFIIFGIYQIGNGIINYFNSQFDIIIIGKLLGSETLGLYTIVKQLIMRPAQIINPIVTRVTFPTMAKIQNNTEKLKEIYLKTVYYLSIINFPIYILMIIFSKEIILLFLGKEWLKGDILFQLLSIYALIRSIGNPIGSLVLAKGKPQYEMYWNIGLFLLIPITIYIGTSRGIMGVAFAWIVLQIVLIMPAWYFLIKKLCGAKLIEYLICIIKPLIISFIIGVIIFKIKGLLIG
ncbi:colanic acid exporter [Nautilia sp. PV-1]|uniref:MOP flippase family protein n=1 Tax=Nautilia sp. PV-1 TaxID=2579250 RepID=UPI000FD8FBB6|nr:MOP flippase family protein [Nautilia sp. PV-1]AZV47322.1 colanic acid exporter [Nautilia sp. PV-1]